MKEGCGGGGDGGICKDPIISGSKQPPSWDKRGSFRSLLCLLLLSSLSTLSILSFSSSPRCPSANPIPPPLSPTNSSSPATSSATDFTHIVFGIAASSTLWHRRKDYIKLWWRPGRMRGHVWLDSPVNEPLPSAALLPSLRLSSSTSSLPYSHKQGSSSALRISRIVSESFRLRLPDARWFVLCDDDTVFFPDNLLRVLNRFDHRQPLYIGAHSESHLQNIFFSHSMAYGGAGFAISLPLAASLAGMQDRCIRRYPSLYGSDDRIQACMAELGIPLTAHPGFHQFDVHGSLLGLLAAHPVAPLVSLHHLDHLDPIFPFSVSRPSAVRRLLDGPAELDSAALMQQSICYPAGQPWTVSVSWGFVVQLLRGVISPREMETPARTFLNWYRRADYTAYAFNTRPVARNPCQKPFLYYLHSAFYDRSRRVTVTRYRLWKDPRPPACTWKMADPSAAVKEIVVYKKPDPLLWDRAARRNCCRVLPSSGAGKKKVMAIDVGVCQEGEVAEPV